MSDKAEIEEIKIVFECRFPEGLADLYSGDFSLRQLAEVLWLGFKEGYKIGKYRGERAKT
jgi:hypothetical protein